jgi:hypothetical protein
MSNIMGREKTPKRTLTDAIESRTATTTGKVSDSGAQVKMPMRFHASLRTTGKGSRPFGPQKRSRLIHTPNVTQQESAPKSSRKRLVPLPVVVSPKKSTIARSTR